MEIETIAIVGPTASGKTRKAVSLAYHLNGEILSADSRQVYRDMTLGTGKDIEEYKDIPYHLIDICEAGEKYNLHRFITDFHLAFEDVKDRGKFPIICGGSGMYVENVLSGIRLPEVPENHDLRASLHGKSLEELTEILKKYKELHNTTDVDTCKRAIRAIEIECFYKQNPDKAVQADRSTAKPLNSLIIGLDIPRELRRKKITDRLEARLNAGMLKEVEELLNRGISPEDLIYYGLEYKFMTLYLIGEITYEKMFKDLETAIHQFAKRQMTWFRGMEKRGFKINWLPYDLPDKEFISEVVKLL